MLVLCGVTFRGQAGHVVIEAGLRTLVQPGARFAALHPALNRLLSAGLVVVFQHIITAALGSRCCPLSACSEYQIYCRW